MIGGWEAVFHSSSQSLSLEKIILCPASSSDPWAGLIASCGSFYPMIRVWLTNGLKLSGMTINRSQELDRISFHLSTLQHTSQTKFKLGKVWLMCWISWRWRKEEIRLTARHREEMKVESVFGGWTDRLLESNIRPSALSCFINLSTQIRLKVESWKMKRKGKGWQNDRWCWD